MCLITDELEALKILFNSDFKYNPLKDMLGTRIFINEYEDSLTYNMYYYDLKDFPLQREKIN